MTSSDKLLVGGATKSTNLANMKFMTRQQSSLAESQIKSITVDKDGIPDSCHVFRRSPYDFA